MLSAFTAAPAAVVLHRWASGCFLPACLPARPACLPDHPCFGLHIRTPFICMHALHVGLAPGYGLSASAQSQPRYSVVPECKYLVSLRLWPPDSLQSHGNLAWAAKKARPSILPLKMGTWPAAGPCISAFHPSACTHCTSAWPQGMVSQRQLSRSRGTRWFRNVSILVSHGVWPPVPLQSHGTLA